MSGAGHGDRYDLRSGDIRDVATLLALQRIDSGAPNWSEALWIELLNSGPNRALFVMDWLTQAVGFLVISSVAGVAEIETVFVLEEHRRKGLGRTLCERALQWAAETGSERVLLEVRDSNLRAIELYRALGFMEEGRRLGYYSFPTEDALVMALGVSDNKDSHISTV